LQHNHEPLLIEAEQFASQGDFESAFEIYQEIINDYKSSPEVFSNFAICSYQIGQYELADELFQQAIECIKSINFNSETRQVLQQKISQTYAVLLYNHGCEIAKSITTTEQLRAINLFLLASNYNPNDYKLFYNIACCYINIDKLDDGIDYLHKTLELNPHHAQAHFALSQYHQQNNNLNLAQEHLDKSLASQTHNQFIAEYNYGVLEYQRGNYQQALEHYLKSYQLNPQSFATCYNIGSLYQKIKNYSLAIEYYKKALALNPEDEICRYLIAALSSENVPEQAPASYIENLFDHYAPDFDHELTANLNYQTPELLYNLFAKHYSTSTPSAKQVNILDLGCGTGLMGQQVKKTNDDSAINLVGVDISQKMLDIAESKNIYNILVKADIEDYLESNNKFYDLIILGDVLVYYGDLTNLFKKIKNNLSPNGYVLFSVELIEESIEPIDDVKSSKDFILNTTGRYQHSLSYVYSLSNKNFKIIDSIETCLRTQDNNPVMGRVVLLQVAEF